MGKTTMWSCWCWRRHRAVRRTIEAREAREREAREASIAEEGSEDQHPLLSATSVNPQTAAVDDHSADNLRTYRSGDPDLPTDVPTPALNHASGLGVLGPVAALPPATLPRISPEQKSAARLSAALMAGAAVRASVAAASAVQEDFAGDLASSAPRSVAGMRCRSAAAAAVRQAAATARAKASTVGLSRAAPEFASTH